MGISIKTTWTSTQKRFSHYGNIKSFQLKMRFSDFTFQPFFSSASTSRVKFLTLSAELEWEELTRFILEKKCWGKQAKRKISSGKVFFEDFLSGLRPNLRLEMGTKCVDGTLSKKSSSELIFLGFSCCYLLVKEGPKESMLNSNENSCSNGIFAIFPKMP